MYDSAQHEQTRKLFFFTIDGLKAVHFVVFRMYFLPDAELENTFFAEISAQKHRIFSTLQKRITQSYNIFMQSDVFFKKNSLFCPLRYTPNAKANYQCCHNNDIYC